MKRISLIVPTYNEAKNLPLFFEEIWDLLDHARFDLEFIVVDDNSPDGTGDVAEGLSGRYPVRVIRRAGKLGLGSAVIAGFRASDREYVGVMDADLSHDPKILNDLLGSLGENDIAIGSRFVTGSEVEDWQLHRRLISYAGVFLARLLTGVRDPLTGYFFLRRKVIEGIPLDTVGYKILLEILVKGNYARFTELPFTFRIRKYSSSKLNWKEHFFFLRQIIAYSGYLLMRRARSLADSGAAFAITLGVSLGAVLAVSLTQSIWLDEGLSIAFSKLGARELVALSASSDLHPPLYNILMRGIHLAFGDGILAYRFLPFAFYALFVWGVYRYAAGRYGARFAAVLAAISAFSPYAVHYASEARSYMMVVALSFFHYALFERIARGELAKWDIALYGIFSIIGAYLFYPFLFFLAAQFLYVVLFHHPAFRSFIIPWAIGLIAYAPWAYVVILARIGESPAHFLSVPWWQIPAIVFAGFAGGRVAITDLHHIHAYWPTVIAGLPVLAIMLSGIRGAFVSRRIEAVRLASIFLFTLLICLGVSYAKFSIFDPRYYAEIFPLFILFFSLCLGSLYSSRPRMATTLFIALIISNVLIFCLYAFHPSYGREPWKQAVVALESELRPGDVVVFLGQDQPPPPYTFYQRVPAHIVSSYGDDGTYLPWDDHAVIAEHILQETSGAPRIWYSQFLAWQKDPAGDIERAVTQDFHYVKTIGGFKVLFDLYERN